MRRSTNRSTVDASLSMTVYALLRYAGIRRGQDGGSWMRWYRQPTGDTVGSIGFRIATSDPNAAHVRLIYRANDTPVDDRIPLVRTPCRFGGWRWWFICPYLGCRVGKLHLPSGTSRFASRRAWPLAYQSSRDDALQCAHSALRQLYGRLGAEYPSGELRRPKGMHAATYAQLLEAIERGEDRLGDVPWPRRIMCFVEDR